MSGWSIVLRQAEAERWLDISEFAFFLCHAEELNPRPFSKDDSRAEFQRFRRIGQELHILEWDLTECLNEFKLSYEVNYRAEHLALKKFSIVYHTDNFNIRIHKVNENVESVLALLGRIDPKRRSRKGEPSRRERVEQALERHNRRAILDLIRQFRERPPIKHAIEERNAFVHIYRDEPERDWRGGMLSPAARIGDHARAQDRFETELRHIVDHPHLDDYADARADELFSALQDVRQLRDDLYFVLLSDLAALVAIQSEEAQRQFRWVLDLDEIWRDMLREIRSKTIDDASS